MAELNEKERLGVILAGAIVLLSIVTIASYLLSGASVLFYVVAIVAVILGFYITYSISRLEQEPVRARKR